MDSLYIALLREYMLERTIYFGMGVTFIRFSEKIHFLRMLFVSG